ncbi:MAG: GntR family transcriptional regulator [Rhizobiaceae bacterium]|nr:GntR family transcriptional regulator [Rhizobiaceae bacterium]
MNRKDTQGKARFGMDRTDLTQSFLNAFIPPTTRIQTLPEQLSDAMVGMIVRGIFKPGERLHEVALAERFQVSRGPVREALRILEREGLVTMPPRRGASVTKFTRQRVKEIFQVRASLMALCAEDLARKHSPRIIDELEHGTKELSKALKGANADEFIVLVYQLSMYVAEMAENQLAREILVSLGRQTLSFTRRALENPEQRQTWASNWHAIMRGIRDGDPVRAGHASIHLVETMGDAALAALDEMRALESEGERESAA